MNRDEMLSQVRARKEPWDILVIGGGATGLGVAVDARSRGYDVLLLEQSDFAKGTSSRSTKLVHGGVRYLQQGNVSLVMEALKERGLLFRNAPHLVRDVSFIVPSYAWWESPFYGIGMKVYDLLAGRYGFGKSKHLGKDAVVEAIPSIQTEGLRGGTLYYDGQFDDARLAINLAESVAKQGGTLLNYAQVTALDKDMEGAIEGLSLRDLESGQDLQVQGKVVINATGPFSDGVRRMDRPDAPPIIAPSQGVHIVLDRSFLPGDSAIMVPHTKDGRVMFAIPWHHVAVVGTTDTAIEQIDLEPVPMEKEIDFILETANAYLSRPATREDITSVFAGIRPLVKAEGSGDTAALSRDHSVLIDPVSGMITVAGGKWTTYRRMAEDVVDQAITLGDLEPEECVTKEYPIHGFSQNTESFGHLSFYGSDATEIARIEEQEKAGEKLHAALPLTGGQVIWAVREEMARTVDDVLARRTRCLLFDARASIEVAPQVAKIMAAELDRDPTWVAAEVEEFTRLAQGYLCCAS